MRLRGIIVAILLSLPANAIAQPAEAPVGATEEPRWSLPADGSVLSYSPGRGLRIVPARLTLGGYGNVEARRDEGGAFHFDLAELSSFVTFTPHPRVHLFSELELDDLIVLGTDGDNGSDADLRVERLYGDLAVSDSITLRFGKFLTPVGRWNVIHAPPLVWTTDRPLTTETAFDQHVTGLMSLGRLFPQIGIVTYQLYGQFLDQFEPVPQRHTADRQAGIRLELDHAPWSVGSSYLAHHEDGGWQHLGGIDGEWTADRFEVLSEAIVNGEVGVGPIEWGAFVQTAVRVVGPFHAIARYEHFNAGTDGPTVNLVDLGVAYRPAFYLTLKLEYLIADHFNDLAPPGASASLAVLF